MAIKLVSVTRDFYLFHKIQRKLAFTVAKVNWDTVSLYLIVYLRDQEHD